MFLRKFFTLEHKLSWILIDLIIVVIGVYGAFWIQSYAEDQKIAREQDRVLTALKYEMEVFRYRMFETSLGMQGLAEDLQKIEARQSYSDFSNFRFIEPQYDYQTIAYAINVENTEVVDFELYDQLQSLFVEVKKIEHVERLLTDTSRRYRSIPEALPPDANAYQLIQTENRDNFRRFLTLINDRSNIARRIANASSDAMPLINERLGPERTREIEVHIIKENIKKAADSEAKAIELGKQFFPNFTEEEIRALYRDAKR